MKKEHILFAEYLGFDILSPGYFQYESEIITSLPDFKNDWNWIMKAILKISNETGFTLVMEENTSYWVNSGDYLDNEPEFGGYNNVSNIFEACTTFLKCHKQ